MAPGRGWPRLVPAVVAVPGSGSGDGGRSSHRDALWAAAVAAVAAEGNGVLLAVDYGHRATDRPRVGSLSGPRRPGGVPPVPDGSCDITATWLGRGGRRRGGCRGDRIRWIRQSRRFGLGFRPAGTRDVALLERLVRAGSWRS